MVFLFWPALGVCVYIYFGYPALLWVLSRLRPRPVAERDVTPYATFVIPAYNEERNIAAKVENTLSIDYPPEQIEVLVVSNGSTDRTNEIVRGFADPRVRLIALEQPGKMEALNEGARIARGEILVLTDADFFLDRHSLREIARKFADPEVGGVCGTRGSGMQRDGDATGEGEGMYGRWDRWQKVRESEIGSVFAADGLLYAIRKELYVPIDDPAQADDIAISARVVLQGRRLLFEPKATAWERSTVRAKEEFRRKVRVTNHSVRALLNLRSALFTRGFYSVELLSHKLVRHFVPFFLITLFLASVALVRRGPLYVLALAGQALVYGLAAAGALLRDRAIGRSKILTVPYYFCFVNAAALFGVLAILRGERLTAWSTREAKRPFPRIRREA
ncbi:MAG TPA: glycosyltransferase family 2 protein [Thermoanaerobaculia bacterium]|jgi:cellulose synthase/poly-beta-1,6-N-acetylglucosamine synthase-like glycosyltransferase|nr:glycosyltransferase family 2 protein [Thermoanaerobaculia bacterium]